jgi:hypothetical protein
MLVQYSISDLVKDIVGSRNIMTGLSRLLANMKYYKRETIHTIQYEKGR